MARLVDLKITPADGSFPLDPLHKDIEDAGVFCRRFELGGTAPTDARSGSPKGTREYHGITIEKRLDSASPALFQLFVGHTGFKGEFRIHKVNPDKTQSASEVALTVSIGGDDFSAWISSYRLIVPDVDTRAANDPDEPYEVIVFSFSKIEFHKSGTDNAGTNSELVVSDSLVGAF